MGHVKRSRLLAAGGVPLLTAAAAVSSAVAPLGGGLGEGPERAGHGPGGSTGWVTVDVGVTPDTAP
jgi:hypothetical protein